jgi:hypothetical protein
MCKFVGHSQNHSDDVYRLFNIKTRQLIKSRDLILLDKDYESWLSYNKDNYPVGDDDSDITINITKSKKI